jgi:hypothetical protein
MGLLNEEISRIKSVMGITESKITNNIQNIVTRSLEKMQDYTFEMGLGEMDELNEITSVDEIKVKNIVMDEVPLLYVDIYVNSDRRDFDNVVSEIEVEVSRYLPKAQIIVDEMIDTRTFGPGIDW